MENNEYIVFELLSDPLNYSEMSNKPKINGVELNGELTAADLELLSSRLDDYRTVDPNQLAEQNYLVVLVDGAPVKVPVKQVMSSKIKTVSELDPDVPIDSYQFVEIGIGGSGGSGGSGCDITGTFKTVDELDLDAKADSYQFVKMKKE